MIENPFPLKIAYLKKNLHHILFILKRLSCSPVLQRVLILPLFLLRFPLAAKVIFCQKLGNKQKHKSNAIANIESAVMR